MRYRTTRRRSRSLAPALLAIPYGLALIEASTRFGRLSVVPLYDDITYIAAGAHRLALLRRQGLSAFLASYAAEPPHSPYSDLLASVALFLFGMQERSVYTASILAPLVLLAAVLHILRGRGRWHRVLFAAYVLTIPFVAVGVLEYRPDTMWAILLAIAAITMLRRPLVGARPRRLVAVGALCGAAILTKPTGMLFSVGFLGLAGLASLAADALVSGRLRLARSAATAGIVVLTAAVLVAPYFAVAFDEIWGYIRQTLFSPEKAVWSPDLPWRERFFYYLTGESGQLNLGRHIAILGGLIVAGFTLSVPLLHQRFRRAFVLRGLAIAVVFVGGYVVLSASEVKSTFIGSVVYAFIILTAAGAIAVPLRRSLRSFWRFAVGGALIVLVWAGARLFHYPSPRYAPDHDFAVISPRTDAVLMDAITGYARRKPDPSVFVASALPVPPHRVIWYAAREGIPLHVGMASHVATAEQLEHLARQHDLTFVSEPHPYTIPPLPVYTELPALIDRLDRDPAFHRIAAAPLSNGNHVLLYERRPPSPQPMPAPTPAPPRIR